VASGFAWMLAQAPVNLAQSELETQQSANDKILQLARNTHAPVHDYVIGRGDTIAVEVFDVPELSRELRVSQTGTIGMPLVPVRLYVVGLTEVQLQRKIAEVLEAQGLVSHPQVMVFVKEKRSKPITVVGAVGHPGVIQADRPLTLMEVLAESGGIAMDAGDTVLITRGGGPQRTDSSEPPEIGPEEAIPVGNPSVAPSSSQQLTPEGPIQPVRPSAGSSTGTPTSGGASAGPGNATSGVSAALPATQSGEQKGSEAAPGDLTPPPVGNPEPPANTISINLSEILEKGEIQNNIALLPGDFVTVPHAGVIYALGAVGRPGGFVSAGDRTQLSTLKLLALAGGTTRFAKSDQAVIIRKDAQGREQSIPVDLKKIVKRESEDVRLLPSDILYVPTSTAKTVLIRSTELAVALGTNLLFYRIAYQ
jgi:polysaccharide export outer membrane protein